MSSQASSSVQIHAETSAAHIDDPCEECLDDLNAATPLEGAEERRRERRQQRKSASTTFSAEITWSKHTLKVIMIASTAQSSHGRQGFAKSGG
jgi:hypothetical protein